MTGEGVVGDLTEAYVDVRRTRGFVGARLWLFSQIASSARAGLALHWSERKRVGRNSFFAELWSDVGYSLRVLKKIPAVTLAAVFTLSLGIGAGTTFFSVTNTVLWRPLPYPDSDRLVGIGSSPSDEQWAGRVFSVAPGLYSAWKENLSSYDALTGTISGENVDLTGNGEPERYRGAYVDHDFSKAFGVVPQLGRWFSPEEDAPGTDAVILISDAIWRNRFGADSGIIGRNLHLNEVSRTVIGVLPRGLVLPEEIDLEEIDVLMPLGQSGRDMTEMRAWFVRVVGLLREGVSPALAFEELERVTAAILDPDMEAAGTDDEFVPAFEMLKTLTMRPQANSLVAMLGASLLLVLMACSNVAHLLLARATARAREFSVRAALGASRTRLIRQLLTESLTLGLAGGVGGYGLATIGVRYFRSINPGNIPRMEEVVVDSTMLWVALAAAVVTGIGFGVIPAIQASGRDITMGLKAGSRGSDGSGNKVRNILVAGEVGVAVIMVVGAALLLNSFVRILNVDPGFETEGISDIRINARSFYETPELRRQFTGEVVDQVAAISGVRRVAFTAGRPFGNPNVAGSYTIQGGTNSDESRVFLPWQQIDSRYLEVLGARLLPGGRFMTAAEVDSRAYVAVVNRAFEKIFLNSESALGRLVRLGGPDSEDPYFEVIGVIEDMAPGRLNRDASAVLYVPHTIEDLYFFSRFAIAIESDLPMAQLSSELRAAVWSVDADQVIASIATLDERVRDSLVTPIFYLVLFGAFGFIALALVAVGTYGTVSYGIAERRLEMGIRLALGATGKKVFGLVVRQGMVPVVIGLGAGLAGALALSRFVASIVFGVSPVDAATYSIVGGVLLVVGVLACVIPARRASKVDPMSALRAE